ncbi:putative quinol monooxygenase [Amycolatopsis pithecellobii]|nr:antibiotic biosynthesis monooxygenase [Amycolatopsis pithecellobii]
MATLKPLPEHRAEVMAALRTLVAAAHTEEGVERFALLDGGADVFVIIEKWVDRNAWEAHTRSAASQQANKAVAGKLREAPAHLFLTPIPAGDDRLGRL